jgi:hypothetical protein
MEAHDECHDLSTLAPGIETTQYSLNIKDSLDAFQKIRPCWELAPDYW